MRKRVFSSDEEDEPETGASSSSAGSKRAKASLMTEMLSSAGLTLSRDPSQGRHRLSVHQEDFRKKLIKSFKMCAEMQDTVRQFHHELTVRKLELRLWPLSN